MSMRQTRKILEFRFDFKQSAQQTAQALRVSKGTVINAVRRFERSGLVWPLAEDFKDSELEARLYPQPQKEDDSDSSLPSIGWIEKELRRPHVTLQRLWEEYTEAHPDGLSRSRFYRYWNRHRPPEVSLKMIHKGGEKLFVDYSGDGIPYIDRTTGEVKDTRVFVSCFGASSYSYADATDTEKDEDFVNSHVRSFYFFKGLPAALVPDNLKSGVITPSRYEPKLNPLYESMAEYYGIAVLPARIRKPKDKAPVENAVLQVQQWIMARLRNRQFFSLAEVNAAIAEEVELLNDRPMKDYGNQSRRERFELLDKPYLRPLPAEPYRITRIKVDVRVQPNYHIRFEDHFYSAPYLLVGKLVEVHLIGRIIELYHDGVHVCRHKKGAPNFLYTTITEHMPPNHRYMKGGWSLDYFLNQTEQIGPQTKAVTEKILAGKTHPEQAYNAARGILHLGKTYTNERLEKACERALRFKSPCYRSVKAILEQGLDKQTELIFPTPQSSESHENIRGSHYYAV
jgi:transposase